MIRLISQNRYFRPDDPPGEPPAPEAELAEEPVEEPIEEPAGEPTEEPIEEPGEGPQGTTFEEALEQIAKANPQLLIDAAKRLAPPPPQEQPEEEEDYSIPLEDRVARRVAKRESVITRLIEQVRAEEPDCPPELLSEARRMLQESAYTVAQMEAAYKTESLVTQIGGMMRKAEKQGLMKPKPKPQVPAPLNKVPGGVAEPKLSAEEEAHISRIAAQLKVDPAEYKKDYLSHMEKAKEKSR